MAPGNSIGTSGGWRESDMDLACPGRLRIALVNLSPYFGVRISNPPVPFYILVDAGCSQGLPADTPAPWFSDGGRDAARRYGKVAAWR
ncbi:hypothetical protein ACWDQO_06730 [Streptomyces sp. NPDC003703]|uniref:hypothetical protein n=1 Tax=unclassified Streptomyces TaxID=2593676 RepID=UPI00131A43FA|nr:hypothetical protein [Streptomyces sp. Tu 6176]